MNQELMQEAVYVDYQIANSLPQDKDTKDIEKDDQAIMHKLQKGITLDAKDIFIVHLIPLMLKKNHVNIHTMFGE